MEESNTQIDTAQCCADTEPEQTDAERVAEIKDSVTNNKKLEEIIDKFKKDKSLLPNIIQLFQEDQQLKRNADNIARMVAPTGTMGQEVPLAQRKKLAQKQCMLRSMAKHTHISGDKSCVIVNKNGSVSSYVFNLNDIDNDKWVLHPLVLTGAPVIAVCNANMTSGKNKTVGKLMLMPVNGPVIFLLMDESYEVINMTPQEFKILSGL